MKSNGMAIVEQNRKKQSIKSMYFNRYLLVRYVSALFFFTNLYWLFSLLMSNSALYVIPLLLIIALVVSMAEQVKIYSNHTNNAKYTKYCFILLFSTNVLLIGSMFFPASFSQLYPFFVNQTASKMLVLSILIFGILLSTLILRRLELIKQDKDKHYKRIKQYEQAMN